MAKTGNSANNSSGGNSKRPVPKGLTPFSPGVSGNPSGRPKKRRTLSDAYKDMLDNPLPQGDPQKHLQTMISRGEKAADVIAFMLVTHIVRGKVGAAIEMRKATEGEEIKIHGSWREQARVIGISEIDVLEAVKDAIKNKRT